MCQTDTQVRSKRTSVVAMLVETKYEDLELWYPVYRLKEAGCRVLIAGTGKGEYQGKIGYVCRPDVSVEDVRVDDIDGLVIPGGYCPEKLRINPVILNLVKEAFFKGKVVAAICHGPQVLISAGVLKGRRVTGYRGIWDDLRNAGAIVVDEPVVVDENLITSRTPDDLPEFGRELVRRLGTP
ncbi:MAG: type 1 glutamine amidotransferase [Firmicutes bacterium]|nr:type 1 glutamine amidotransferase [Candidatus Fermentithermobacillaceae bacterium]